MLALLGLATLVVLLAAIMSGRVSPLVALIVVPTVASFVGGFGALGGQGPKRARKLATRLAQESDTGSPELRELLDDRPALVLSYLSAAQLLAIIVLMVFKPGAVAG